MGQTITTFLIDGDPKGAQYVMISNKRCQMYIIPRSNLDVLKRAELQTPTFYILLGEDDNAKPKAYIGETENFRERVRDHDSRKAFWNRALLFISMGENLTKGDVQYLEYLGIKNARESNRFVLDENKQTPKAPNLPEHLRDNMDQFFDDVKFLTAFSGCNIFELSKSNEKHLFHLTARGCNATGYYDAQGFTVLKGSIIANTYTDSFHLVKHREAFIKDYIDNENGKLVINCDTTFNSPSTAAAICCGRNSNGWKDWKDEQGQSLDSVYRKSLE